MRVLEAQALGMCFGVRDALDIMRKIDRPTQVTVFGQLVHNPAVEGELTARGFARAAEDTRSSTQVATEAVLITAHGVSDRQRAELLASGKTLIDTTCPLVKKAHAAALALARSGHFVVIAGRRGHVEIRGLTGDLPQDSFAVVECPDEVTPYDAPQIAVMSQTTTLQRDFDAIFARVRELHPQSPVRRANTICAPTRDRQAALQELLTQVNILVVVGGRHSNNTRHLVQTAEAAGIRALHVESAAELYEQDFRPWDIVGLTAGTSTLPETVARVKEKLTGFYSRNQRLMPPESELHRAPEKRIAG
jgi:4-hydroxy-3-methylbut-2-en-1-yl diphosphate reductase